MKHLKYLLIALGLLIASQAEAASRFAVCSVTCTWDNSSTAMWSASSGGATGASVPGASDTVTFDGSTCVGGVTCTTTVAASVSGGTISTLTTGACTASTTGCVIDFAANNVNLTMASWNNNGTGTRTIKRGTGTFTYTGGNTVVDFTTTTNLTYTGNTGSTDAFAGNSSNRTFITGSNLTFGNLSVASSATTFAASLSLSGTNPTFTSLAITAPARLNLGVSFVNITNAFSLAGTNATNLVIIEAPASTSGNPTLVTTSGTATCNWCFIQGVTGSGGATFTATNSFGYNNSNITVTGPAGTGGGHIIGG